jgi:hypothetical protein
LKFIPALRDWDAAVWDYPLSGIQVLTCPVHTEQDRSLPLCSTHSLMDVGGFVLKAAACESRSLFRISPALRVTLRLELPDGVCSCLAPCLNYVAVFRDGRHLAARPVDYQRCVRDVRGANVGWDTALLCFLCLFLHVSPGLHFRSALTKVFPATFILVISIVSSGEVRSAKLMNWLFGVRFVACRCEVRKPNTRTEATCPNKHSHTHSITSTEMEKGPGNVHI